jgi:hypothetical protein
MNCIHGGEEGRVSPSTISLESQRPTVWRNIGQFVMLDQLSLEPSTRGTFQWAVYLLSIHRNRSTMSSDQ